METQKKENPEPPPREAVDRGRVELTGEPVSTETDTGNGGTEKQAPGTGPQKFKNNARRLRMERMMSKAELARRAGVSTLTIDRVERGLSCRMDTKRKIIEALGLKPSDRSMVFADDE